MKRRRRTLTLLSMTISCTLLSICGCKSADSEYHKIEKGFQVTKFPTEFGPHNGHRITLENAPFSGEIIFDESNQQLTLYLLDENDNGYSKPTDNLKIDLQVPTPSVELQFQPNERDEDGDSPYQTDQGSVPQSIKNEEQLRGKLTVSVGGKTYQGAITHNHGNWDETKTTVITKPTHRITQEIVALTISYCVLIVLGSLLGGWLPNFMRLSHTRMQIMMSLVGGLMLGIGLFHMLPHAVAELGSLDRCIWWMMLGVLVMFLLIRTFHFHQHGPVELVEGDHSKPEHDHDHDHDSCTSHHGHSHHNHKTKVNRLSWVGVALGLSLHTAIDGLALGASIQADAGHGAIWSLYGVGTFLAILLHKPLDAVSITSLMASTGWSTQSRNVVNLGFSLMCPLGAGLFLLGANQFTGDKNIFVGCALAFAAGVFLVISLGDLLPELEFHTHDRVKLTGALILGVALAYAIGFLEPEHTHKHGPKTLDEKSNTDTKIEQSQD